MPFAVLQGMRIELGKQLGVMQALNARLLDLQDRSRVVVKATEQGKRHYDPNFDKDFAHLRMELRTVTVKTTDFEHFADRAGKVLENLPDIYEAVGATKNLYMVAKNFKLETDNFVSTLAVAKNLFRKMPVTVYWWELEQSSTELVRVIAQIMRFAKHMNDLAAAKSPGGGQPQPEGQ
ncbi:MAG: hypothetical protein GX410_03330 [Elusimicrobia bacterium]|nr:hypothetical protein [Elusimicrobiota bacterium]